jgi:hypothetical protein
VQAVLDEHETLLSDIEIAPTGIGTSRTDAFLPTQRTV